MNSNPFGEKKHKTWMIWMGLSLMMHSLLLWVPVHQSQRPTLRMLKVEPILPKNLTSQKGKGLTLVFVLNEIQPQAPLHLEAVHLWKLSSKSELLTSHVHWLQKNRRFALQIPLEPGNYRLEINAEKFSPHTPLDGEYSGAWPTGDGREGGDFIWEWTVEAPLQAQISTPSKRSAASVSQSSSPKALSAPLKLEKHRPIQTVKKPKKRKGGTRSPKVKKSNPLPRAQVDVQDSQWIQDKTPSPSEWTEIDPQILSQDIEGDLEQKAQALEAQAREQSLLGDWQGELKATREAFAGKGARVRAGNLKSVDVFKPKIWQYIALMHRNIHRAWANQYLMTLDLLHRDLSDPLNNPNLETLVEIEVNPRGYVSDVRLIHSSGIMTYDAEAIRVARHASTGLPTPKEMRSENGMAYIHWHFWRDTRQCGTFGVSVYILNREGEKSKVQIDRTKLEKEEKRLGIHSHSTKVKE